VAENEANQMLHLMDSELELCRQWFDAVQDLSPGYLTKPDFQLAAALYDKLGMRVPNSIKASLS
jgi:hypothetical protein